MRGLVLAICVAGCAEALPLATFDAEQPEMRPEAFFAGTTRSTGVLEDRGGAPTARFGVVGAGRAMPNGSFAPDQSVAFEGRPVQTRTWTLRRLDDHRYTGTLTDASGPVAAEAYGNLFHLTYSLRSQPGGAMEQWLYLQPDGVTVLNEATVRVFGVVVARLSERITRAP